MPTPLSSLPLGPGRVAYGSGPTTLYSAGDIKAQIKSKWNDLKSDQYGDADKALVDQSVEVGFKPQSLWSLLATVYPTALINPTLGTRLIGTSPSPLKVHGENSSLFTVQAPCITALPSLTVGLDKAEFGDMKFTGVTAHGKAIGDSDSLYKYEASGGTYGTPSVPDWLGAGEWTVAWGSAITGLALDAITITPELKVEAVMAGEQTVDYRVMGCQFKASARFGDDLVARSALFNDAATHRRGGRGSALGSDLVLTSSLGHTFTLHKAVLDQSATDWSMKDVTNGAIEFVTAVQSGARVAWTTPS